MNNNKILIDDAFLKEQTKKFDFIIDSIGFCYKGENTVKFFGDIILPDNFEKNLILKIILYDDNNQIVDTDYYATINKDEDRYTTFCFEFLKDKDEQISRAKFFLVEENRYEFRK